jgi:hypothetical protein
LLAEVAVEWLAEEQAAAVVQEQFSQVQELPMIQLHTQ